MFYLERHWADQREVEGRRGEGEICGWLAPSSIIIDQIRLYNLTFLSRCNTQEICAAFYRESEQP